MTRRGKWILGITLGALTVFAGLGFLLPLVLERALVKAHTKEVRQWGEEYSSPIYTDQRAFRVIEMMEYMADYYKAFRRSPGLEDLEQALEEQRERSLRQVADALEDYTGKTYGTDVAKWQEWAKSKGFRESG